MRDNQQPVSRIANPFITQRLKLPATGPTPPPRPGQPRVLRAVQPAPRMWPAFLRLLSLVLLFLLGLGLLATTAYLDQQDKRGVVTGPNLTPIPFTGDNPLGANVFLEKEVDRANVDKSLQMLADGHFKYIRQSFIWSDIEISGKNDFEDRRNPGDPVSAWAKYDYIVDKATALGLQIMARVDGTPDWARKPGANMSIHGPPANNQDYADFVAALVARYKGKVSYFQLWNEPNLAGEWDGYADPAAYTELLKSAYSAAKQANPAAVIVMAALAQTDEHLYDTAAGKSAGNATETEFLQAMYNAGAKPYFDIASVMTYGLGYSPDTRSLDQRRPGDNERINFSRAILFRETMEKNNDSAKPVWASEYAWVSLPPDWTGKPSSFGASVDEQTQAQYLVAGYQRALSEWPWMGVMFVWNLRDPYTAPTEPARYFAIVNPDFSPRPAYTALSQFGAQFPLAGVGAYTDTAPSLVAATADSVIKFDGSRLDLTLDPMQGLTAIIGTIDGQVPANWQSSAGRGVLSVPTGASSSAWTADPTWPAAPGTTPYRLLIAEHLAPGPHTFEFTVYKNTQQVAPSAANGLLGFIVSREPETPWRAPLAYTLIGILLIWSGARFGLGVWRLPRLLRLNVRRPGLAGANAANNIAAAGMAVALVVYYFAPFELLALLALLAWFALAVWRPAMALGVTAAVIPFYWVPRTLQLPFSLFGSSMTATLPLSETCLWLTLAAWALYKLLRPLFVRPARQPSGAQAPSSMTTYLRLRDVSTYGARRPARRAPDPPGETDLTRYLNIYQELQGPATPWQRFQLWARRDLFGLPALALFAVGTFSLLTVASPDFIKDSLHAYRWVIVEPLLFYFLATDILHGRQRVLRLLDCFAVGAFLAAFIALLMGAVGVNVLPVEGVARIQGLFPQPNNLAIFMGRAITLVGVTGFFLSSPTDKTRRRLYLIASAVMVLALALTFSRGAYVGVAIALVATLLLADRRKGLALVGVGLVGLGVALVAAAAGLLPQRLISAGSSLIRLDLWQATLPMLRDHPIFGVGLDQFLNQLDYYSCDACQGNTLSHPHNLILDCWLSLGIMGMLIGGWIVVRYWRSSVALSKRSDTVTRAVALGAFAMLIDFLAHGLVDNSYFLPDLALVFWLACVLIALLYKQARVNNA